MGMLCALLLFAGCSNSAPQQVESAPREVSAAPDGRVHGVISTSMGLFIVVGQAQADTPAQGAREYLGWNAELVAGPSSTSAPNPVHTLVSESRSCQARAREPKTLWLVSHDTGELLAQPVEAVLVSGCDELELHEWIAALAGAQENVRWTPLENRSPNGPRDIVAIERELPETPEACAEEAVALEIVRGEAVEAALDAAAHVGIIESELGRRDIVYLSTDRRNLRSWRIQSEGLQATTEIVLPLPLRPCVAAETA